LNHHDCHLIKKDGVMKKINLGLVLFLFLGYFVLADNNLNSIDNLHTDDFKINFSKGDDTVLGVDVLYDYYFNFNKNLHSEIGYINKHSDSVENFTLVNREGKKGTKIKEEDFSISLLYNFPLFTTFGLEYQYFTTDKEQSGYYQDKNSYLPFEHVVDIKGNKINIVGKINYPSRVFDTSLKARVSPSTKLDIRQNTKIFPDNIEGGELSSDSTLGLSYNIDAQVMGKFGKHFLMGVEGYYEFIPYEYQLKVKDGDSYREKTQTYDEKIKEYFTKVCVKDFKVLKDFFLVFRYGKKEVSRTGMNSVSENIFTFGIDRRCTEL